MTTSVIQQKGLHKDDFVNRKRDSLVSQKWGETPSDPTTLFLRGPSPPGPAQRQLCHFHLSEKEPTQLTLFLPNWSSTAKNRKDGQANLKPKDLEMEP